LAKNLALEGLNLGRPLGWIILAIIWGKRIGAQKVQELFRKFGLA